VSHAIGPFLASVGEPVLPLLRDVFQGNDHQWKYWCIDRVVMRFRKEVAEQLRADLERFAYHPSSEERSEEVDGRAWAALEWLDGPR
jgi:Domain of unknown function (DUF5071)